MYHTMKTSDSPNLATHASRNLATAGEAGLGPADARSVRSAGADVPKFDAHTRSSRRWWRSIPPACAQAGASMDAWVKNAHRLVSIHTLDGRRPAAVA